ncbi:uncharacterized protein F5Z01DRAFT_636935 [Emericellopsis atlantica]|uniref:Uncharacterized protein n=1 Tax=Emericellopsis atlantica TaxID=2614577 RepID=A0A9P7ZL55_9HYPO|nr:uncharacterized protein F5Z01DRAFT_636935 [Emericellopsis atlantica]KAG9253712.1 hypothetical protein F5Z01DRAFT_636935 [Emericellopsis atlantica]
MQFTYATLLSVLSAVAHARQCEMKATVSNGQIQSCGWGPCNPIGSDNGNAILLIDGEQKWNGGSYGDLSLGDGTDFDADGVTGHIQSIGLPARGDNPRCEILRDGQDAITAEGTASSWGLPGTFGQRLSCDFLWDC